MLRRFAGFYTRNFDKRPLLTISCANCVLGGVGDAAAQALPMLAGSAPLGWDVARSARFLSYGFLIGPVAGKWNELLEYRIPLRHAATAAPHTFEKVKIENPLNEKAKIPGSPLARAPVTPQPVYPASIPLGPVPKVSLVALGKRVAADQLFMAPVGIFVFIAAMSIMEGLDLDGWLDRLKRLYMPILLVNWQAWPIIQAINFRYMPLRYRVPFTATCGILWTVFISTRQAAATAAAASSAQSKLTVV